MINGLKSIRRERAALERDRVVIGSMVESAQISEQFNTLDEAIFEGTTSEDIEELIDKIPESEDDDDQVERILSSDEDLDVDGILGIDEE